MISVVFSIDYEIYGNGAGRLRELVSEPAARLQAVFERRGVRFVNYVEAAEFERISALRTDDGIGEVERQIREHHEKGFEVALHLHPQWCRAVWNQEVWELDYSEYNLCTLGPARIAEIVDGALGYLRSVTGDPAFVPLAFRAGNWLFQPTRDAARVLAARGIRIDSSVFKGGLIGGHGLDYRPARRNGWWWRFDEDVNRASPQGGMLEMPIYTEMVPFWRMLTRKRVGLQSKVPRGGGGRRTSRRSYRDYLRFRQPLKFDFCRMNLDELTGMMRRVQAEDSRSPGTPKPVVAIGHTKDLVDLETVDAFLIWLEKERIPVRTFREVLEAEPDIR